MPKCWVQDQASEEHRSTPGSIQLSGHLRADLVVVLRAHEAAQGLPVLSPDLVLVALHEGQQALVPHHRHGARLPLETHKVVHKAINLHKDVQMKMLCGRS